MLYCYSSGRGSGASVCAAFAEGCGGQVVDVSELREGDVFVFGVLHGVGAIWRQARQAGRVWYYADTPYFKRPGQTQAQEAFRVTRNAVWHDGSGTHDSARFKALGLRIKPWRKTGTHVLVCPPGATPLAPHLGYDPRAWLETALGCLSACTDRPIRIRHRKKRKLMTRPLTTDLVDCWALVTHSSNAAVEAVLAGVPIFVTYPSAASSMGSVQLDQIEWPLTPDGREQWASNLAANQWTRAEMRSGQCWRQLCP